MSLRTALAAILLWGPVAVLAGPPSLSFPVDCTLGQTCFIQQYVDTDPSKGARDHQCGPLSYDGHKGTDIRLVHRREVGGEGVAVRAAAPGVVLGTRNHMPDIAQGEDGAPDVTTSECGNGVVVDHGQGWHTQYCHMRKGSVQVRSGQQVDRGAELGRIGLSGLTQFPHLHFKVTQDTELVDPFRPTSNVTCGKQGDQLWDIPIAYQPGGLLAAGFATHAISYDEVQIDPPVIHELGSEAPALVVWAFLFGVRTADEVTISLFFPDGTPVITDTTTFTRNQAQAFRLAGKRRPQLLWPVGHYKARVEHRRDGNLLSSMDLTVNVD